MPLYLIERNFAEQVNATPEIAAAITEVNANVGIEWLFSFLSADKKKTYCLYEAPNPDAIREAARKLNLPADVIVELGESRVTPGAPGLMTPTRGVVRVRGRSIAGAGPEDLAKLRRDHIGFIFQSYHLFPTLTAEENVRLALDVRGQRSGRTRIAARESLAMVGLAHKTKAFPIELSGGEQQRVAIARAIVGNASAILADEPTGALDTQNGQAIMAVLAEIAKDQSRGVLVVTHDPRILSFANRVVHIEDGRIVREEPGERGKEQRVLRS